MKVICETCGKEFDRKPSEIGENIFCSQSCFHIALKKDKTINGNYKGGKYVECIICGKQHYRTPFQMKTAKDHPTCSVKCLGVWNSQTFVGEKAHNYKGKLKTVLCKFCEKEIKTYNKERKYCSLACRGKAQRTFFNKVCVNCGETFTVNRSTIKWSKIRGLKIRFCSNKCKYSHCAGKNHPAWVKDRTLLYNRGKSIRKSKKMQDWRVMVFERDDYTCQMCHDRSAPNNPVALNAHHIKQFNTHKHLRFDLNNGITLCESCHKKTYWKEKDFETIFQNRPTFIEDITEDMEFRSFDEVAKEFKSGHEIR